MAVTIKSLVWFWYLLFHNYAVLNYNIWTLIRLVVRKIKANLLSYQVGLHKLIPMFSILKRMKHSTSISGSTHVGTSYEEAIKTLCLTLQSNTTYLQSVKQKNANDPKKLEETEKYLLRSGITMEQLDRLSFIHVAGSKGKGSTCAFTETILRQHGFNTGFFSSPHLISVRERIRINGEPISKSYFVHSFWKVYRKLEQNREHELDMPMYFKFLTILMFHVFLEANVDVAIVEVGMGGELDCTNILRNPVCVGVTSLALEHTSLLGNTLEQIAQQKSGIFKPNAAVFTVPQEKSAMRVLQKRAVERRCRTLKVISSTENQEWNKIFSSTNIISDVQRQNASLSIHIALEWMKSRYNKRSLSIMDDRYINNFSYGCQSDTDELSKSISLEKVTEALANYKWPGRMQILKTSIADFFVDGAHTTESIVHCISWFRKTSHRASNKFLIFNTTGDRDSLKLLKLFIPLNFDKAYFTPNYAGVANVEDLSNYAITGDQRKKCKEHCEQWGKGSVLMNSVAEVLTDIKRHTLSRVTGDDKVEVLVTGSLYLVGALLTILDPNLTMTSDF